MATKGIKDIVGEVRTMAAGVVTLVIPAYNEAAGIEQNLKAIIKHAEEAVGLQIRVLLVDDGSGDETAETVSAMRGEYPQIAVLSLNRNFGKEAAIQAGLEHADSDAVIVMDSDLQHPPSLIPRMIALWQQGNPVVEAYKLARGPESMTSWVTRLGFYGIFRYVGSFDMENETDFKLLDKVVVQAYLSLPERVRFFRGLVRWLGFASARIPFDVPARQHGTSVWSSWRLWRFSLAAITSFSSVPLQCVTVLGLLTFAVSLVFGGIAFLQKISGRAIGGFTTVIILLLFIGSILMFSLGLLGLYLARIYDEIKARPRYVVNWSKSRL